MITESLYKKAECGAVIALGRFDGLHLGHKLVVEKAKELAKTCNAKVALFTLKKQKGARSLILSFEELSLKAGSLGIDELIYAEETPELFGMDKDEFLSLVIKNRKPLGFVFGEDYTFGKDRAGDAGYLADRCEKLGIPYKKVPILTENGQKISSTAVKELLKVGDIESADRMLGGDYYIVGEVVHGRNVGTGMGFPTINVSIDDTKLIPFEGVYETRVTVFGKTYKALTSIGTAPTFVGRELTVESYLKDFDHNAYGEKVKVDFKRFLRKNVAFSSENELISQLKKDLKIYD